MENLLYDIFNGDYDITPKWDKKQREITEKLCVEWDKVQTMFGDGFMDRLLDLEAERDDRRAFHYYRAGFRLGVRLMLEAVTPA